MIPTNAFAIQHRNGMYLQSMPTRWRLVEGPFAGGRWSRYNADALMPLLPVYGVNTDQLSIVPAPACGCCGEWQFDQIRMAYDHGGDPAIRCERHVGRLPCLIKGCGRTFRMQLTDGYASEVICGQHWRLAPRAMRDAVARVRKLGKRRDWPDDVLARHHRLWRRTLRAILQSGAAGGEGAIDLAEIEAMFGLGN